MTVTSPSAGAVPSLREGTPVKRRQRGVAAALAAATVMGLGLGIGVSVARPGVASAGTPVPGAPNCPMFPADNVWNTPITGLPVDAHNAAWMASMHASTTNLHP